MGEPFVVNIFAVDLVANPLVPQGKVWNGPGHALYLHPITLRRLKDHLWADQRTLATVTYAELMIALQTMRPEEDGAP